MCVFVCWCVNDCWRLLMTSVACFEYRTMVGTYTYLHSHLHCTWYKFVVIYGTYKPIHTYTHVLFRVRPSNDNTREFLKLWLDYNMILIILWLLFVTMKCLFNRQIQVLISTYCCESLQRATAKT